MSIESHIIFGLVIFMSGFVLGVFRMEQRYTRKTREVAKSTGRCPMCPDCPKNCPVWKEDAHESHT